MQPGTYAHFDTTEGRFTVRLFQEQAPRTVENFIGLAEGTREWTHPASGKKQNAPLYDGIVFHRVIDGFMIQGGDPLGQGTGGPGYKFADEFKGNPHKHQRGSLSMANAGPNTNGSQFFITHIKTDWLDGKHTVFGQVRSGQEVVDSVKQGDTLKSVTIEER